MPLSAGYREATEISSVKPVNYDLSLYDLELGGAFTFQGTVKISVNIKAPTKQILLNSYQLKVNSAQITGNGIKSQDASKILYIEKSQRVSLDFAEELSIVEGAVLELQYSGVMNNDMAGFYRSRYKPEATPADSVPKVGEFHFMFSTQFESCDARRALPCFDEPNLKASFDVSIEIPHDQVALSNMPEKAVKDGKNGRKVVSFERTPVMSTYLLAWAFGGTYFQAANWLHCFCLPILKTRFESNLLESHIISLAGEIDFEYSDAEEHQ